MTSFGQSIEAGDNLVALANRVTATRFALVVLLALVAALFPGGAATLSLALVICVWISDVVDGNLARAGGAGAAGSPGGRAFDPAVDDLAYAVGFLVLSVEGLVPIWFVFLVLTVRSVFMAVRIVALAQGEPFPAPRFSGKGMGVALGLGQILLFATSAGILTALSRSGPHAALLAGMSVAALVALADFVQAHRGVLLGLLSRPGRSGEPTELGARASAPRVAEPLPAAPPLPRVAGTQPR